jgi:hypothetical protein
MIVSNSFYTRPLAAVTVTEQLQSTIDHSQKLADQWEGEMVGYYQRVDQLDVSIRKLDTRSKAGWWIAGAGGALVVAGLVYGAVAGPGTVAAIPGILVTFGGLGLAQFSDLSAGSQRRERGRLQHTVDFRRELLDKKVYPQLESARASLQAEEERQHQEMQALLDGMRSVGQLSERAGDVLIGGSVLRKRR